MFHEKKKFSELVLQNKKQEIASYTFRTTTTKGISDFFFMKIT